MVCLCGTILSNNIDIRAHVHLIYASMSVHAAITVHFEEDMYMVQESDGVVDITLVASGRTSFEYTVTVTPMDLTATSRFDNVL